VNAPANYDLTVGPSSTKANRGALGQVNFTRGAPEPVGSSAPLFGNHRCVRSCVVRNDTRKTGLAMRTRSQGLARPPSGRDMPSGIAGMASVRPKICLTHPRRVEDDSSEGFKDLTQPEYT